MKRMYIRDKRSPLPTSENASRVMSANRARNTIPELLIRKELTKNGVKGYRLHAKKIFGRPDIYFANKKITIFINGCFWHFHGCKNSGIPKSNTKFWKNKLNNNKERDIKNYKLLKKEGWRVIVLWECDIEKNLEKSAGKIVNYLK